MIQLYTPVARDRFEPDDSLNGFDAPCCWCKHRNGTDREAPCRTCDHNRNAEPHPLKTA